MTPLLAAETAQPLMQPEILIGTGLLAFVMVLGAVALFYADRWKKRAIATDDVKAADDLAEFRTMFERGEITEEEYDRIRQKTAQRLKTELGVSQPPPPINSARPTPPPSLN